MHIRTNSNRYKTFLIVFLSFTLYFNGFSQAYAANVGGWNLSNPVAQGASTVYDASKNVLINGKDFVKDSWVKITPTATGVAKVLRGGAAGYALSVAVEQLLGAVDWVLDPANNAIKYRELFEPNLTNRWLFYGTSGASKDKRFFTPEEAALDWFAEKCASGSQNYCGRTVQCPPYDNSGNHHRCGYNNNPISWQQGVTVYVTPNPNYDPDAKGEEKSIPLTTVAQKVISNAESDTDEQIRVGAQVATTAAAANIVTEAETDNTKARPIATQAEANAETKPADADAAASANTGAATATPQADPVTGEQAPPTDIALEFPVFCNWAPTICEAAQVVISFPNTLTGWYNDTKTKAEEWAASIAEAWTAAREYFEKEPEPEQEEPIQIQDPAIDISVTNYIQGNAYCPNDREIPLSMGSHTLNLIISYQPLCSVAQQFKPAVILMAFLAGAFIITNTGRRAEVGD